MILGKNNFNFLKNISLTNKYLCIFIVLIVVQILFWNKYVNVKAELEVVSTPPNEKTMNALSFGDKEYYFRLKSFQVQNMGDTFGRFTSLKKYDYKKLYNWFIELEKLNYDSNYLPSLMAYYFSQTPIVEDKIYVVNFLKQHSLKQPEKKWWWLYQASYIANYEMKNKDLAIELASKLKEVAPNSAPLWAKQTVGMFLAQKGNSCEAVRIISEIMNELENNTTKTIEEKNREMNYMKFFLEKEISKLKEDTTFQVEECFFNNNGSVKNE